MAPKKKVTVTTQKAQPNWLFSLSLIAVTVLAVATRFYSIGYPDEVVFDEVHFGKFASYYLERTYFFDLHPPFAKLLIAFVGYLIGFNGAFKFDSIGDSYITHHVPYKALRSLSALIGSATVPLVFLTLKECNYSLPACLLATMLVLFDNAHVAETRLILLDSTLIFSVAAAIYCYVRFSKERSRSYSVQWWKWLLLTGLSLSCVISTKYVGVFTYLTIGCAVVYDLWMLMDVEKGLSIKQVYRHIVARFFSLVVLPFIIYLGWFYIHFAILNQSGTGDGFMSAEFQETLGDSPLAKEARQVNFHDVVLIKNKDTEAYLHSHPYNYPLRYEDGRVSSQGQQVTCLTDKSDESNYWEILPASNDDRLGIAVKQSDTIRLRHVSSQGFLLTHDVASPLFPTNEEFTVVSPELAEGDRYNDTLFRLDPFDKKKSKVLKTKGSFVRFVHVPTVVAMWTHNDELLPDWGFNQQEVNGNKKMTDSGNLWSIDEIIGIDDAREVYTPKEVKKMPFLSKWLELQSAMFEQNNKLTSEHPFASEPQSWPFTASGVSFWTKDSTKQQIFFVGNVFGWWLQCALLACYGGLVLADQISRRRKVYVLSERARSRLYKNLGFFVVGWMCHYFPFFLMNRQKFLHHYLPAHLILALFSGGIFEFLFTDNRGSSLREKGEKESDEITWIPYTACFALLASVIIWGFLFWAPLTYGNVSLTPAEVIDRQWLNIKLHYAK